MSRLGGQFLFMWLPCAHSPENLGILNFLCLEHPLFTAIQGLVGRQLWPDSVSGGQFPPETRGGTPILVTALALGVTGGACQGLFPFP